MTAVGEIEEMYVEGRRKKGNAVYRQPSNIDPKYDSHSGNGQDSVEEQKLKIIE